MAKSIKKGDIVRRQLRGSKALVGSLKVVDDVDEFSVYAHDIPQNSLGSMSYKPEDLVVIESVVLRIQNDELKHIINDNLCWVQHPINKSWENALMYYLASKKPIVAVTLVSSKSHIIVTEPRFSRVYDNGTTCVKLRFVRILESTIR